MKTLNFTTPLTKLGIYATLKEETEITDIRNLFPLDNNNKYFRGEVKKDEFEIFGFKKYSNNIFPAIFSGKVSEMQGKTFVDLTIRPSNRDIISTVAFFGMTFLLLMVLFALDMERFMDIILIIPVVLIFQSLFLLVGFLTFKSNARRTLSKLKKLLQLEQI